MFLWSQVPHTTPFLETEMFPATNSFLSLKARFAQKNRPRLFTLPQQSQKHIHLLIIYNFYAFLRLFPRQLPCTLGKSAIKVKGNRDNCINYVRRAPCKSARSHSANTTIVVSWQEIARNNRHFSGARKAK